MAWTARVEVRIEDEPMESLFRGDRVMPEADNSVAMC